MSASTPRAKSVRISEEPPNEIIGSGTPVFGMTAVTTPRFIAA